MEQTGDLSGASFSSVRGLLGPSFATDPAFSTRYVSGTKSTVAQPGGTGNKGDHYFDTTNNRIYISDGVGWVLMSEPPWSWTPSITGITVGNGVFTGGGHRCDGWIDIWGSFTLGTTSAITGDTVLSLPIACLGTIITAQFNAHAIVAGNEYKYMASSASPSIVYLRPIVTSGAYASNGFTAAAVPAVWAAGNSLDFAGRYPMATRYL